MGVAFWIQIAVYVLTGLLAIARVSFIVGRFESRCATKDELEKAKTEGDEKRARIYQRFDEYKQHLEGNFVRKEMCVQTHITARSEYEHMDKQFTDFRHDIREAVSKLQFKMDEVLSRLPKKE